MARAKLRCDIEFDADGPEEAVAAMAGHFGALAAGNQSPVKVNGLIEIENVAEGAGTAGMAARMYDMGVAASREGRWDEAGGMFREALSSGGDPAKCHHELGFVLRQGGDAEGAAAQFREAARHDPSWGKAWSNLAACHNDLNNWSDALEAAERAVEVEPTLAIAWYNLGIARMAAGDPESSLDAYAQCLTLDPSHREARNNAAIPLMHLGRYEEALENFHLSLSPLQGVPETIMHMAFCHLLERRYPEGFALYEWRWHCKKADRRELHRPRWRGQAVNGTVMVHAEQGLGDAIQMMRYIPEVAARCSHLILVLPPALGQLARDTFPSVHVVVGDKDVAIPPFDYHLPMMSLPLVMNVTYDMPPARAYIRANPEKSMDWAMKSLNLDGKLVGLAWAGSSTYDHDDKRTMNPELLGPLGRVPGVTWVNLQVGREDTGRPPLSLRDYTPQLVDLADTAALVQHLDLVVTVDSAVAHLAGALGRPVWLLNRFSSCWRWGREGDDTPWYKAMRIFRQESPGDWGPVIERVRAELEEFAR